MKITFENNMTAEQICSKLKAFLTEQYGENMVFSNPYMFLMPSDKKTYDEWKISKDSFQNLSEQIQDILISKMQYGILSDFKECEALIAKYKTEQEITRKKLEKLQQEGNGTPRQLSYVSTQLSNFSEKKANLENRMAILENLTNGFQLFSYDFGVKRLCNDSKIIQVHALMTFQSQNKEDDATYYCYGVYSLSDKSIDITYPTELPIIFLS